VPINAPYSHRVRPLCDAFFSRLTADIQKIQTKKLKLAGALKGASAA
jgi:hypothetical protein